MNAMSGIDAMLALGNKSLGAIATIPIDTVSPTNIVMPTSLS